MPEESVHAMSVSASSDCVMRSSAGAAGAGKGSSPVAVVAIKGVAGSSKAEEWNDDMLQTGDVVEELRIGNGTTLSAPFKNGKSGLQKELHKFYRKNDTLVRVRVRRGRGLIAELQACITPDDCATKKQQYTLRALSDPNYVVAFVDSTQEECLALQESRDSRVESALSNAQLKDGYVAYPWEKKMHKSSGGFFSLLIIPHAPDRGVEQYNDLEDTMDRAYTWLTASQASGVPIIFLNIQTEPLLTKISDERAATAVNAGALSDLSSIANASLYGLEDYHGIDIGVVRAVRLWYSPVAEIPIQLKLKEGDTRLGFAISRTDEGFFFISSVMDDPNSSSAASRAGLNDLYRHAQDASKLLVISRVSNEKIVPWTVSSAGAIRCFDSISLSQKLSLHRHARRPVLIHFMLWEEYTVLKTGKTARAPLSLPLNTETNAADSIPITEPTPLVSTAADNSDGARLLSRDTAGEFSFRNQSFTSARNSWV